MLGGEFENSLEMTARRMVELGEYACAIVFSRDKTVLEQTVVQGDGFKVTLLSYDPE